MLETFWFLLYTIYKNCHRQFLSVSTKSTTLSKDKRNRCGKTLLCVFPPIPPFQRKLAPQTALPLLTAGFLSKSHCGGTCPPTWHDLKKGYNLSFFDRPHCQFKQIWIDSFFIRKTEWSFPFMDFKRNLCYNNLKSTLRFCEHCYIARFAAQVVYVIITSKARCAFENIVTLLASLRKWFML